MENMQAVLKLTPNYSLELIHLILKIYNLAKAINSLQDFLLNS
jgi:hypothetical protein